MGAGNGFRIDNFSYRHWKIRATGKSVYCIRNHDKRHPAISRYNDAIMSEMASQIIGVSIVCSTGPPSKKTSKLRVTGLCKGNPPVTGGFPSQRPSNAEDVSICRRDHDLTALMEMNKYICQTLHEKTLHLAKRMSWNYILELCLFKFI